MSEPTAFPDLATITGGHTPRSKPSDESLGYTWSSHRPLLILEQLTTGDVGPHITIPFYNACCRKDSSAHSDRLKKPDGLLAGMFQATDDGMARLSKLSPTSVKRAKKVCVDAGVIYCYSPLNAKRPGGPRKPPTIYTLISFPKAKNPSQGFSQNPCKGPGGTYAAVPGEAGFGGRNLNTLSSKEEKSNEVEGSNAFASPLPRKGKASGIASSTGNGRRTTRGLGARTL